VRGEYLPKDRGLSADPERLRPEVRVEPTLGDLPSHPWDQPREAGEHSEKVSDLGNDGASPPGSDAGYDATAAAREDYAAIAEGLEVITQELQKIADELRLHTVPDVNPEELQVAERQQGACKNLDASLAEMLERGPGQDPDLAFSVHAQSASLKGGTKYARKRWPGRAWDTIWHTLKRILPLVWSFISHLVRVREWSVSGQVGTGLVGLLQAKISVTFG